MPINIFTKMQAIVSEQLCVDLDKVVLKSSLTEDLGADSLDVVEVVMSLEEAFDMKIPETVVTELDCLEDALVFIIENRFSQLL
ncbi:MAG: acyl carrier protein [Alphaproteobacteria bacterium]|nr:acyl carrier protein [Alphaproteobacteria bacterium]